MVNAAVKSDFIRMVSKTPILAFSCNLNHHSAQNVLETHEFVSILEEKGCEVVGAKFYNIPY